VPVGGGGLIAGIAAYVKYLRPEIKVIGVEPDDSNCLQAAMAAGERVVLPRSGSSPTAWRWRRSASTPSTSAATMWMK
jgi:threonine dehydratase